MLDRIPLQSTDYLAPIRSILGDNFSVSLGSITPYIVFGVIIAAFVIVGIIGYRGLMTWRAFGNALPLGRYRIINMGDRKILTGYLSKLDVFEDRDDLDDFTEIDELMPLGEKIIKLGEKELLNFYYFNIFDWGNAIRGRAKRVIVMSNQKLEQDNISWIDETGSRTWRSILNKEYIRNVVGYENSKYYEIKNPDKNIDGYYALAVIPRVGLGKKGIIMSNIGTPESESIMISPSIIENSKDVAQAASFLELVVEGQRKIKVATLHTTRLQDIVAKEHQINLALKMKVNKLRRLLIQQIIIGYAKAQSPLQQVNSMVWIMGGGIAVLFGCLVVPDMDGVRETNIPNWLVGGAALLVVIIVKYIVDQKAKPIDGSDIDERPENMEKME